MQGTAGATSALQSCMVVWACEGGVTGLVRKMPICGKQWFWGDDGESSGRVDTGQVGKYMIVGVGYGSAGLGANEEGSRCNLFWKG